MSRAQDNPVYCAERENGCQESFPGSKWNAIRAANEGWFFSKQEDKTYCPKHVPKWVAEWRAKRRAQ